MRIHPSRNHEKIGSSSTREFRDAFVAVARRCEAPLGQIALDLSISVLTLHNWLKRTDVEDEVGLGVTIADAAQNRQPEKLLRLAVPKSVLSMRRRERGELASRSSDRSRPAITALVANGAGGRMTPIELEMMEPLLKLVA